MTWDKAKQNLDKAWNDLVKSVKELQVESKGHRDKWWRYEQEYILPCFDIAKARGINLEQLVKDNPGKNCVILLIEALQ